MTTEQESTESKDDVEQAAPVSRSRGLSRKAKAWSVVIAGGLVAWFFFAWLVMGQDVVDAAGESVGSAFLLLLLASIVSAIRERRGRRQRAE